MTEMRKDRRAPISLKVKYKSATVDDFIEQFGADVSRGGIFIKTKKPLDIGALLKFEFQLQGGEAVIHGVGRVAWRRGEEHVRPDMPAGMGIKFIKLDDQSRLVIDRIEVRHGPGSRFDQSDGAELAPSLSSIPNAPYASDGPGGLNVPVPGASGTSGVTGAIVSPPPESVPPGNRPTPLVPAASMSDSTYPSAAPNALPRTGLMPGLGEAARGGAEAWDRQSRARPRFAPASLPVTFRPPPSTSSSLPPALGDLSLDNVDNVNESAAPAPVPRAPAGALGQTGTRRTAPSTRSPARDTSEFLASAFNAGGVGQDVRSQARAQVERARHDPKSVDLASELFGDFSEATTAVSPRDPLLEAAHVIGELRSRNSESRPPSLEELRLTERIPSIDELVNESSHSQPELATLMREDPAQSSLMNEASSHSISEVSAASLIAAPSTLRPRTNGAVSPLPSPAPAPANAAGSGNADLRPLSLGLELPTGVHAPAEVATRSTPAGKGRGLWTIVLGALFVVVAGGVFMLLRPSSKPPVVDGASPPLVAAEPAAAPEAAKPAVPVALPISSTPRGAEVMVDGTVAGITPITLNLVDGSTVELSLRSPGHVMKTEKIAVVTGMPAREIVLPLLPHVLMVATEPPGATATVGAASTETPQPLDLGQIDGNVTVVIEKAGYAKQSRVVKRDDFKERDGALRAELSLNLVALSGRRGRALKALAPPEPPAPPAPGEAPAAAPEPSAPAAAAPEPAAPAPEKPVEKPAEKPPEAASEPDPADKLY